MPPQSALCGGGKQGSPTKFVKIQSSHSEFCDHIVFKSRSTKLLAYFIFTDRKERILGLVIRLRVYRVFLLSYLTIGKTLKLCF